MQIAFNSGRKQKRGSRAAQKAVSSKRVRRRRHAQTRRRFSSALRSTHAFVLRSGRSRLGFKGSAKGATSSLPVPAGAQATLFPGFSGLAPSKTVSLLLLAAVAAALYWLYTSESFYIYRENVRFEGAQYLSQDELFAACDIDSWSIFWLDPEKIEEQVMAHPYVTAADAKIRWPGHIEISVQEVRPVALWATEQQEYWLLEDGAALAPRELDVQPALRIIDPSAEARIANVEGTLQIDKRILTSAMILSYRLSIVNEFWYNSLYGLNFSLPSTQAWIHWGDGYKFEEKWTVLQSLKPQLEAAGDEAVTLNVSVPNRSFTRRYDDEPDEQ
ncbi:MAG: FtsQ-type POTRA domain-containing protein [Caldilineaceae bacterium SB0661_bin_32]|uniref:FtsQ-type POTRA domain-containing protein n=1 Tax=Caldilineaceae bacterium SB0661_bin_32 TaxID=2605255 RepID=A0A6B1DB25_9CHLR|nr:FtsQ-type POTRA domain-containing protein [Caldilineaceae bacterium SB0661_bin_32]